MLREAPILYRLVRALISAALKVFADLEIRGIENLPRKGPVVVATNHIHWLDSLIACVVVPRWSTVLASSKWSRTPVVGWINRASRSVIFMDPYNPSKEAVKQALDLLGAGRLLGLAPEGARSVDGTLRRGHRGAAFFAMQTGASLVPLVLYGQEKTFDSLKRLRRAPITAAFGMPLMVPGVQRELKARVLETYTNELMHRLASLLPSEYRGRYSVEGAAE